MQERLIELHQQRGRLIERITTQRQTLARELAPMGRMFDLGWRIRRAVDDGKAFVRQHPAALVAVVAALVLLKPRVVWRWGRRGLLAWRAWRNVGRLLPNFLLNQFRARL